MFLPDPFIIPSSGPAVNARELHTHGWEPLTIYAQLNESLNLNMPLETFCRRFVAELRRLRFREDIVSAVQSWRRAGDEPLLGVHIRRTDRSRHHREQFRNFLMRKQGLNRELPLYLNVMYGLFPAALVRHYENGRLISALRRFNEHGAPRYAVFSDDDREAAIFEKAARRRGVRHPAQAAVSTSAAHHAAASYPLRKSTVKEALIDLLRLASCDAIAQSNRASTFSIAAAVIGAKPIVTEEPRYPFWRAIKQATGHAPNDPALDG